VRQPNYLSHKICRYLLLLFFSLFFFLLSNFLCSACIFKVEKNDLRYLEFSWDFMFMFYFHFISFFFWNFHHSGCDLVFFFFSFSARSEIGTRWYMVCKYSKSTVPFDFHRLARSEYMAGGNPKVHLHLYLPLMLGRHHISRATGRGHCFSYIRY
jgi:hypothetical protein